MQNSDSNKFTRQEKQTYLRNNILESQYEEFSQFCQNQSGIIDIDSWSFNYVKNLVQRFKQIKVENQKKNSNAFQQFKVFDNIFSNENTNTSSKAFDKKATVVCHHSKQNQKNNLNSQSKQVNFKEFNQYLGNHSIIEKQVPLYINNSLSQSKFLEQNLQKKPNIDKTKILHQQKIKYEGLRIIKQDFEDVVKCFKMQQRPSLAFPNLSVQIINHQIIHRRFLAPDYVMFIVKVNPTNIQCKRNYEDFIKLRQVLLQAYPGLHIPYLQKCNWFFQTNPETVIKLKVSLQMFLNDLISNKNIRNSKILQDFITMKEHKRIKRKFQEYERMLKPKSIEELCLDEGKLSIKIKQEQRIYQQKMSQHLLNMQSCFEKHTKLCEVLKLQYQNLIITVNSLYNLMMQAKQQVIKFNRKVTCNQIKRLAQSYQIFGQAYKYQLSTFKFDLQILDKTIFPFLRYQKENTNTIKEIIETKNALLKQFLKRSSVQKPNEVLKYDSQKYFNDKKAVLQESKNIVVLKYQTGYICNQVCQQSQRVFQQLSRKMNRIWNLTGEKYLKKTEQGNIFWRMIADKTN